MVPFPWFPAPLPPLLLAARPAFPRRAPAPGAISAPIEKPCFSPRSSSISAPRQSLRLRSLPMPHHERGSLRGTQLLESLFHFFPQLGVHRQPVRRWPFIERQVQGILLLLFRQAARCAAARILAAFLPHAINRVIRRYPVGPSPEIRARAELPQVPVGPQKSLLNHFLGVMLVSRHAVRQTE